MTIKCEIASQDRLVFEGEADIVVLPGVNGEMGILPNHAPLLTTLAMGVIKVRLEGAEEIFTVTGGLAEIQPDIITILADAAENVEEIDIARHQPTVEVKGATYTELKVVQETDANWLAQCVVDV